MKWLMVQQEPTGPTRGDSQTVAEHALRLADGRRLSWDEAGDPGGVPIFFFHGAPGSGLQRRVFMNDEEDLRAAGVRLISPDRPGVGHSDPQPDRRIADWPGDVATLARHLRLGRFAVLGFSGGTPYAVAVAASNPRVGALGIVSGDAPPGRLVGIPGGLPATAAHRPGLTAVVLWMVRLAAQVAPDLTADRGTAMMSEADRRVVSDPGMRRRFIDMLRDALRQGPSGTLLDLQLADEDWDLDPPRAPIPVHIWHGEADADSPVSIARFLARRLPRATLHTFPDEGHVSVFVHHAGEIVRALRAAVAA